MNEAELMDSMLLRAQQILAGQLLTEAEAYDLAKLPDAAYRSLLPAASSIRHHHFSNSVHLCTILNAKSGRCSEDCSFCSQSVFAKTDAPVYPLMEESEIMEHAEAAHQGGIHRFSVVTSGKGLPQKDLDQVSTSFEHIGQKPSTRWCASLGVISAEQMQKLADSGISRYHHNLEASKSHYTAICTTHSYEERVQTIKAAQKAGMSVCSGGIFGLGESDEQAVEMALALRDLHVDSVPLNFLMAVPGTKLAEQNPKAVSAERAMKLISIFRLILPDKHILLCGGRSDTLKALEKEMFAAGASGIMTGNYLTREGSALERDLQLIADAGYQTERH